MFVSKPFFSFFFFSCRFHQLVFCACLYLLSLPYLFFLKILLYYIRVPYKHRIYTSISRIQLNFLPWIRCRLKCQLTHFAKKKQRNINLHMRKMCLLSSNNCFSITVFFASTGVSKLGTSWHKKKKKKKSLPIYIC